MEGGVNLPQRRQARKRRHLSGKEKGKGPVKVSVNDGNQGGTETVQGATGTVKGGEAAGHEKEDDVSSDEGEEQDLEDGEVLPTLGGNIHSTVRVDDRLVEKDDGVFRWSKQWSPVCRVPIWVLMWLLRVPKPWMLMEQS
ncbi:hypothetical protein NE237_031749 [Protea cynaroides]|uniref:Uncharacterized protein n=1 Tax=Protea cynaroides TaxID=273540 RepID=A0A9Q0L203_9MAGN|nr:hypothetical protein NE237_031749 [Protea cynaroides]